MKSYLGNVFSLISTNLQTQFFMTGGGYAVLVVLSGLPLLGRRKVYTIAASDSMKCQSMTG